jgi:hypothetical protein
MVTWIVALLLLVPGSYQDDDCGDGLPCGPIPFDLPSLPLILSPTPFPTVWIQATPTPTVTPIPTPTPDATATFTPVPTATLNATAIVEGVEGLEELSEGTPQPVIGLDGVEYDIESIDEGAETATFWSYIRGLFSINLGKFQPVLVFSVFAFGIIIAVKSSTLILYFLAPLIGLIRKAIDFVLKFIPGLG